MKTRGVVIARSQNSSSYEADTVESDINCSASFHGNNGNAGKMV
jgi:hypothetical protein